MRSTGCAGDPQVGSRSTAQLVELVHQRRQCPGGLAPCSDKMSGTKKTNYTLLPSRRTDANNGSMRSGARRFAGFLNLCVIGLSLAWGVSGASWFGSTDGSLDYSDIRAFTDPERGGAAGAFDTTCQVYLQWGLPAFSLAQGCLVGLCLARRSLRRLVAIVLVASSFAGAGAGVALISDDSLVRGSQAGGGLNVPGSVALAASALLLLAAAGGWWARRWVALSGALAFGTVAILTHLWAIGELLHDHGELNGEIVELARRPEWGAWLVALAYAACGLAAVLGGRSSWDRDLVPVSR